MFHVRERLHRLAYQHQVTVSIELMLIEALVKANEYAILKFDSVIVSFHSFMPDCRYFQLSEIVKKSDIDRYLKLNDSIYLEILNSESPLLAASKEILSKIESRNIFKFVSGTILATIDNTEATKQSVSFQLNFIV
jgi:hypothetical protein